MDIAFQVVRANGINIHLAEAGAGPVVVLCHGFPEAWRSWRHQISALAGAGYRVIAPDVRGYGQTDRPEAIDQYTIFHLVGDMVGMLDALDVEQAAIVGHDWGAPVAWHAALFRPDRFRAVAGLSVPFFPRTPRQPTSAMPVADGKVFYQTYFQFPGRAEAELETDVRRSVRGFHNLWSGEGPTNSIEAMTMVPEAGGMLTDDVAAAPLPAWATEADIDDYAREFERSGFRGPLNWYRNIDRNWELTAPWAGAQVMPPALYMIGERDLLMGFRGMDRLLPNLERYVPNLRAKIIAPECGHWIQREKAELVSAALIEFLDGLA